MLRNDSIKSSLYRAINIYDVKESFTKLVVNQRSVEDASVNWCDNSNEFDVLLNCATGTRTNMVAR